MNRRNFFGAIGALGAMLTIGRKPEVRFVEFSPPREKPAIYWMPGHDPDRFVWQFSGGWGTDRIPREQIKLGYATRKLSLSGIYLSDTPQEGFEPIAYWIRADYLETTSGREAEDRAIRLARMAQDHQDQLEEMRRIDALRLAQIFDATQRRAVIEEHERAALRAYEQYLADMERWVYAA